MAKLRVEIVTPTGSVLDTEASAVRIPGAVGEAGILPDHRPGLIMLSGGAVVLEDSDAEPIVIQGGVAEVRPDGVLILADNAGPLSKWDRREAEDGLKQLDADLNGYDGMIDDEALLAFDAKQRFFRTILGG